MAEHHDLPPGIIAFGPDGNCNLDICPVKYSIYGYRPSLAASGTLIALYAISACIHLYLGLRWKTWFFTSMMIVGALNAIIGYTGRIIMYYNPFNFDGFMIQIVCITCGPVFYTAAIYVTLAAAIEYFSPAISRFPPRLFYAVFIPFDIVCLTLQAAGGALSTTSSGSNATGVDLALAGLSLQVVGMVVFAVLFADYLVRYARAASLSSSWPSSLSSGPAGGAHAWTNPRVRLFFGFVTAAFLLILTRCAYRVAELHQGYSGSLIRDQGLFIGLEGVMVVTAAYCLMIGHPGLLFSQRKSSFSQEQDSEK